MTFPRQTERLTLRFPIDSDVEPLTAYRNDPQVAELQDWELPYTVERAQSLVRHHHGWTDFENGRGHQVMIELGGELVGDAHVGLHEHGGIANIGFTLTRDAQGRGIAFEAMSNLIDDVVERFGVHRILAELSKDNLASARLLERLGLTFESFTQQSFWWRGAWDDNLYYSMTGDEWRAWRDRPRTPPSEVRLVEIDGDNRHAYSGVAVHRSQNRFVASVQESYADAFFAGERDGQPVVPVLRGIEAEGEPAGFLMHAVQGDSAYLWRLLIDRHHQGRGIGRTVMAQWFAALRAEGASSVMTSWAEGKGGPEPFCRQLGFTPTGDLDEGEIVARLEL